jgi:hypothetical protein
MPLLNSLKVGESRPFWAWFMTCEVWLALTAKRRIGTMVNGPFTEGLITCFASTMGVEAVVK